MSACAGSASPSGTTSIRSSGRPAARPKMTGVVAGRIFAQTLEGAAELPGPRLADRIVERDDEAGRRRRVEPLLDQLPRLQIVRQRDGAEIMPERRADAGCDRQHRGDARHDRQVERAPFRRSGLDRLADRRRHGEDAGIAARDHRDPLALGRLLQRRLRARNLLAVVGGDLHLVRPQLQPVDIGPVAVEPFRRRDGLGSPPASPGRRCRARAR